MDLFAAPFLRDCAVEYFARPNVADLRRAILKNEATQRDFSLVAAPLPPLDQTHFKLIGNRRTLLLGVAMLHRQMDRGRDTSNPGDYESEALELFLDLQNDGIGWQQFIFGSDGAFGEYAHLPYPEAHSSVYPLLRPAKWETREERFAGDFTGAGCRWFFVWFDARQIFRCAGSIGLNVCRSRAGGEFSAWNFPAGNGAPDASGFGVLHAPGGVLQTEVSRVGTKPKTARDFQLSVTYDPPMCVVAHGYTPQSLHDEMATLKSWGISRLDWIDYSDWPSFWQLPLWRKGYEATVRDCGDFLTCAAEQAHANDLEFIADFKVFDLGFNGFTAKDKAGGTREFEGYDAVVIPEIAAHPEWTMQSNAAWRREYSTPATTLRFYSDEPLREIKRSEVQLLVSDDNKTYRPYRGRFALAQRVLARPHQRWTPAGKVREKGSARNWMIELSGLKLSAPFVALRIAGEEIKLHQRGFMLMEALDGEGNELPFTLATKSTPDGATKYFFWKDWPGWANVTEPLLQRRAWSGHDLGFALREMTAMPTLLEPTYEGARQIWLSRIARLLDAGADGVNLRILCHHNGPMNYLLFAFAPVVVEEFRQRFGRDPQTTPEDYARVRRIRGEAFTRFVREAKQLCAVRGKKLIAHLESGIEVPPQLDTRMQLHLDYKTWLNEKLVDEVSLKFFSPYNRFVHREILPLAHKQKIPVHVISRNLNGVLDARALETIPQVVSDARRLGFSGYNFYEAANLLGMNSEGVSLPKGLAEPALKKAAEAAR